MEKIPIQVKQSIPLKGFSTFKIGGKARYFAEVADESDLREVLLFVKREGLKVFFLGGGSNTLFNDEEFDGIIIKINTKGIVEVDPYATGIKLKVGAGEVWDDVVSYCTENGYYGLENLSSIPGTIGGAVVQNIGAYGSETKDYVLDVCVFDMESMSVKILSNKDCHFGYRMSVFKEREGKNLVVMSVTFALSKEVSVNISYKDLKNYFNGVESPSPKQVRDAVIEIRKGKFPDLNIYGTAGSFFKNIICPRVLVVKLIEEYPDMPVYKLPSLMVKISTAFVLDKVCGLRNFRIGDVGLFEKQSLVVVNYGSATSEDVKKFISEIKKIVKEKTEIILEEEVVII